MLITVLLLMYKVLLITFYKTYNTLMCKVNFGIQYNTFVRCGILSEETEVKVYCQSKLYSLVTRLRACLIFNVTNILGMSVLFSGLMGNETGRGTNKSREPRSVSLGRFVSSAHRFIFPWTKKKDTHSLYLQFLQHVPYLKFSDKRYKFKLPTAKGTYHQFYVLITARVICPTAGVR